MSKIGYLILKNLREPLEPWFNPKSCLTVSWFNRVKELTLFLKNRELGAITKPRIVTNTPLGFLMFNYDLLLYLFILTWFIISQLIISPLSLY